MRWWNATRHGRPSGCRRCARSGSARTRSGTRRRRTCCGGGGHQHDPCLAGACIPGNDERVRGGGSGDEGQGAGRLRGGNARPSQTLEGGRGLDGVPPRPLTYSVMWRPTSISAVELLGHAEGRHISNSATFHTKAIAFRLGLRQHCTDIIRFSHGASSGSKVYRSSFIPGLHDVCMVFEKSNRAGRQS